MKSPKGTKRGRKKGSVIAPSGIALIQTVYFEQGEQAAGEKLQKYLGRDEMLRPCHISDVPQPSLRTDVTESDRIWYSNYSPPTSWNAPYSVQLVRFEDEEKTDFMFHRGEELLVPVSGQIMYHFFWSPGGQNADRVLMNKPAEPGTLLRVNSQIPHHTWAAAPKGASAWMIFRYATDSPAALHLDEISPLKHARRRRISLTSLRKPGRYALIAWGISELIRDTRQRAGLTTSQLADLININPSSLSRLEDAKANVSIEMMLKVCRVLRIGLADRISSGSWHYDLMAFPKGKKLIQEAVVGRVLPKDHALHPRYFYLPQNEECTVKVCPEHDFSNLFSSWIVLAGRVLIEMPDDFRVRPVVLDEGNVIHFRQQGSGKVKAMQDSRIVQIVYSQACGCR